MPDAGRVITGTARGVRLRAPGAGTRPLSDRVKQALFAIVEAEREDAWDVPMLDAFAGSGAAAIEALSRGAPSALLIEDDGRAAAVVRANLRTAGVDACARIVQRDAVAVLRAGRAALLDEGGPYGVAVLDPPYDRADLLAASLAALGDVALGWLDAEACVVAKHFWRDRPPDPAGDLVVVRERRFGETALSVYRRSTHGGGERQAMSAAIYPGSFDPVTLGHLDVVRRASAVFERLVVGVLENTRKSPTLDAATRAGIIREAIGEELADVAARVDVTTFRGLTVDFARQVGAGFIVRGLRAVSDFESELQMAHLNRKLAPDVDTVFLMTGLEHAYLSSSMVREIASFGGDVSSLVPRAALEHLGGRARAGGGG